MNEKSRYLLANYQQLMEPDERIAARWLTEEWDGESKEVPKWIRSRTRISYPYKGLESPENLARAICLRLLKNHKSQINIA